MKCGKKSHVPLSRVSLLMNLLYVISDFPFHSHDLSCQWNSVPQNICVFLLFCIPQANIFGGLLRDACKYIAHNIYGGDMN